MKQKRRMLTAVVAVAIAGLVQPSPAVADVQSIDIFGGEGDGYVGNLTGTVECSDDQAGYPFRVTATVPTDDGGTAQGVSPRSRNRCTGSPQPFNVRVADCDPGLGSGPVTVVVETFTPDGQLSDTETVTETMGFEQGAFRPPKIPGGTGEDC